MVEREKRDLAAQLIRQLLDGVINSDARMTYTAVNAILTDRDPETMFEYQPLVPMFELMRDLFDILNRRRRRRGSISSRAHGQQSASSSPSSIALRRRIARW